MAFLVMRMSERTFIETLMQFSDEDYSIHRAGRVFFRLRLLLEDNSLSRIRNRRRGPEVSVKLGMAPRPTILWFSQDGLKDLLVRYAQGYYTV